MNFINFDPSLWSDAELDKLIDLWIKFENIAKSCKEVNKKIFDATKTNDSLKSDIKASTDRCNQIIDAEYYISIESANEIVQLSKNIRKVRKQEDELEKQIAGYKKELVSLRNSKDEIVNEINSLSTKIQGRILNEDVQISGEVKVENLPDLTDLSPIVVDIDQNAIIQTKKSAVVILKSAFENGKDKLYQLAQFIIDRINSSKLVKNIETFAGEVNKSQQELDERMRNFIDAMEAAELAKKTDEELNDKTENNFEIKFLNGEKPIEQYRQDLRRNEEELQHLNNEKISLFENRRNMSEKTFNKELNSIDKYRNIESDRLSQNQGVVNSYDKLSTNLFALNNLDTGEVKDTEDKEELKTELRKRGTEIVTAKEALPENLVSSIDESQKKSIFSSPVDSTVTPLDPNQVSEIAPQTNNEKLKIVVDNRKDTVANATQAKIPVITRIYSQNKTLAGITPMKMDNNVVGYSVGKELKAVQNYYEKLGISSSKSDITNSAVGNIFGTNADENVSPLKL